MLRKKAQSRKEVVDIENVFITTTMETNGLSAPEILPRPSTTISLIEAIELFDKDNLLALARF